MGAGDARRSTSARKAGSRRGARGSSGSPQRGVRARPARPHPQPGRRDRAQPRAGRAGAVGAGRDRRRVRGAASAWLSPHVAVLAAGRGTRFGGGKLEAIVRGQAARALGARGGRGSRAGAGHDRHRAGRRDASPKAGRALVNPAPGGGPRLLAGARGARCARRRGAERCWCCSPTCRWSHPATCASWPLPARPPRRASPTGMPGVPALLDRALMETAAALDRRSRRWAVAARRRATLARSAAPELLARRRYAPEDLARGRERQASYLPGESSRPARHRLARALDRDPLDQPVAQRVGHDHPHLDVVALAQRPDHEVRRIGDRGEAAGGVADDLLLARGDRMHGQALAHPLEHRGVEIGDRLLAPHRRHRAEQQLDVVGVEPRVALRIAVRERRGIGAVGRQLARMRAERRELGDALSRRPGHGLEPPDLARRRRGCSGRGTSP